MLRVDRFDVGGHVVDSYCPTSAHAAAIDSKLTRNRQRFTPSIQDQESPIRLSITKSRIAYDTESATDFNLIWLTHETSQPSGKDLARLHNTSAQA